MRHDPDEPRGRQRARRLVLGAAALAARLLPMRGFEPWLPSQSGWELHISHWTGPLPDLEISPNWTYDGRWEGLFGRLPA
jgi:hypothetical protein